MSHHRTVRARRAAAPVLATLCCLVSLSASPAAAADPPAPSKKPEAAANTPDMAGTWEGKLAENLRLVVHLGRDTAGAWKASVDSPDQNAMGLAVDAVTVSADSLVFTMRQIGGEYGGLINKDHSEISGTWKQGGAALPLIFRRRTGDAAKAGPPARPQEPKPPFPYDAIEVTYANPNADGVTLAGTLTLPKGKAPAPCAVLITGSGPEDRDETIFGHKPFLVLADHLTRRGIAVLRSDDRGVGKSTGKLATATSEDFGSDVSAAVAFLKTRKEIDPGKIGLIGHSEGGLIAPMVASRDKSVAFVVLLAGPGVPGDSILITQSLLVSRSMGFEDSAARRDQATQREILAAVKESPDSARVTAELRRIIEEQANLLPQEQRPAAGSVDAMAAAQARVLLAPWMRFFLAYDPRPALSQIQCPVMALNGERDIQVSAEQNLPEIRAALQKGGNKDATVETVAGVNHLFQTAKTGSVAEYSAIEETFAPAALEKISDWIRSRMGRGK
jgi:pimeloyl-ACP methyl ester carboxylesterase